MKLTGIFPAIVTPFSTNGIDENALREHIEWLISEGVHGIVPCGTTGEAASLTKKEYAFVVRTTVSQVNSRVPVIAGAGANITSKAIELSKLCADCGADALLHVTPYYNKPTQTGLRLHFEAVANSTELPIILYNVPGRTGVNMEAPTVAELARHNNIVGLKDAAGDIDQSKKILSMVPENFSVLSGDDALNYKLYSIGERGAISVTANIAPARTVAVWEEHISGNAEHAADLHEKLSTLNKSLFIESNPIPVKTALALMGACKETFRLPMCEMSPANREELSTVLRQQGLIK